MYDYFVRTHHCVHIITFYLISYKNVIFNIVTILSPFKHHFRSFLLAVN